MTTQAEGATPDFFAAYRNTSGNGLPLATSATLNSLPLNLGSKPVTPNVVCIFS